MTPVQLPVHDPNHPTLRAPEEVRHMATAIQANLTRLRDRDAACAGIEPKEHDIRVPNVPRAPSAGGALLSREAVATLSPQDTHMRLHEVWGQFCTMCWLFGQSKDAARADLTRLTDSDEMHCETAIEAKHAEVHALFWRIVFEQRRRHDPEYVASPLYAEVAPLAECIPAAALGVPVSQADDGRLLLAACQHAGMLAVLRWVRDARLAWGDPALTTLNDRPF